MKLRQLSKLLSGLALLATGLLFGAPAPAGASAGGCVGDVVVALDLRVVNRAGEDSYVVTLDEALPPGVWSVATVSSDSYASRPEMNQPHEQWLVDLGGLGTLGPTSDLADGVESARAHDALGSFTAPEGLAQLTVRHVADRTQSPNSVNADCIGFTLVEGSGDGLEADGSVDCASSVVDVAVHNTGRLSATFHASLSESSFDGTLAPGELSTLTTPISGPSMHVVVDGDGVGRVLDVVLDTSCSSVEPPTTTAPSGPTTTAAPDPGPTTTVSPQPPTTTVAPGSGPTTTVRPDPQPTVPPTTVPTVPSTTVPSGSILDTPEGSLETSVTVDCASGEVWVLLDNQGTESATVDVALPLADVVSAVRVAGGSTVTTSLAIGDTADGPREVRVSDTATGERYATTTVEIDCRHAAAPTARAILDCAADEVVVRLRNAGGEPAALTVFHERVEVVAHVTVAAGDTTEASVSVIGREVIPVRVVDDAGHDLLRAEIENVCDSVDLGITDTDTDTDVDPEPDQADEGADTAGAASVVAELVVDCDADRAEVVITREGVGRERLVVLRGGTVVGVVAIEGDGSVALPVTIDGSRTSLVVSRSGAPDVDLGGIRCRNDGVALPLARSMVVLSVAASAAGVAVSRRAGRGLPFLH